MDALLGAARQGDIGQHFPDNDKEYEGISSIVLLRRVHEILCEKGFYVSNIDTVIIAQAPKMSYYFEEMINNIANALDMSFDQINIKATTTEELGFEGQGKGIAAYAVVLLN
jgi:2-C-methyl-D-erythritol 2,4-cyclodiphosphate synthase